MLSALAFRDFRLYWAGLGISTVGDGLQSVAGGWLIARLTDSAAVVGGVTGSVMLPLLGLILLGGVLADRFERRKILLVTQSLLAMLALAGSVVVALGHVSLPLVVVWFLVLGALLAFNAPPEHALVGQLVPPSHLPSALVLRETSFSTAQMVGAGLAVALLGLGSLPWLFFINALSFLPLLVALWVIRPLPAPVPAPEAAGDGTFREGLRYAWGHRPLRALLIANALIALLIHPFYKVFLPLFVKTVLGGSAQELGRVMFGAGLGTILGSLALARVAAEAR
ncbi:MAG TPA: MFS transporter, partial [Archangium sp.]|uniref:MFS transporter n=1 Tax=Archangium sp. TaxID=1872627 RepID=UPI002EDA1550